MPQRNRSSACSAGLTVNRLFKLSEGRPHLIDMTKNDEIDFIINTPSGKTPRKDEVKIRSTPVERRIPILTTINGVEASIKAMRSIKTKGLTVKSLQEYHLSSWDSELSNSHGQSIDPWRTQNSTLTSMHSMTGYRRVQAMTRVPRSSPRFSRSTDAKEK
jgi:MGS-like domain